MKRLATVLLVDQRGWILLQLRDEHAQVAPSQWGMVGGHVEADETFEAAVYRELQEETGVRWAGGLTLWRDGYFRYSGADQANRYQIWTAHCGLSDENITVAEGRQIVFVDPADIPLLDLSESAAFFVPEFLKSPTYRHCAEAAATTLSGRFKTSLGCSISTLPSN